jgi:hypothetical protein
MGRSLKYEIALFAIIFSVLYFVRLRINEAQDATLFRRKLLTVICVDETEL